MQRNSGNAERRWERGAASGQANNRSRISFPQSCPPLFRTRAACGRLPTACLPTCQVISAHSSWPALADHEDEGEGNTPVQSSRKFKYVRVFRCAKKCVYCRDVREMVQTNHVSRIRGSRISVWHRPCTLGAAAAIPGSFGHRHRLRLLLLLLLVVRVAS